MTRVPIALKSSATTICSSEPMSPKVSRLGPLLFVSFNDIAGHALRRASFGGRASPLGLLGETALAIAALGLLAASLVLVCKTLPVLGKQCSMAARVVEGHELVTSGVYDLVRHHGMHASGLGAGGELPGRSLQVRSSFSSGPGSASRRGGAAHC